MQICLFGGAFDPPHLGHEQIAQTLLSEKKSEQVWFLPVGEHAFEKHMSAAHHRVAMLELILQPAMRIERFELEQPALSITYETLVALSEKHPEHSFSFVMGSDNIARFAEWHHYAEILEQFPFFVYPREGFSFAGALPGMIPLEDMEPVVVSSTQVRAAVQQQQSLEGLVNPAVARYIQDQKLYR